MSPECKQKTYLGVELSAVVTSSAVQSDDLVTDDVVAGRQVPGNRRGRSEVVADEVVGDPCLCAGVDNTGLRDLPPAKGSGSKGCAVTCWKISHIHERLQCNHSPLQGAM